MPHQIKRALLPLVLGFGCGCSPLGPTSGGCEPPRATDVGFVSAQLQCLSSPCVSTQEAVRGSNPHLVVNLKCNGESNHFLVGVAVDGRYRGLVETSGRPYEPTIVIDTGPWEPADGYWHEVTVRVDPLNLFKESNESNNSGSALVRIVEPDAKVDSASSGFIVPFDAGGDGFTLVNQVFAGTPVEIRLRMEYGGPYASIVRSVRSGAALDRSDTVNRPSCSTPSYLASNFVTRWVAPGPGSYDVEFRITPASGFPNAPRNDVVVKRLTVLPTGGPTP